MNSGYVYREQTGSCKQLKRRGLLTASALAVFSGGMGFFTTNEVRKAEVSFLEAGIGSSVVFLPDLHLHTFGDFEKRVVESVNKLEPDVVVFGGDMVDEMTNDVNVLAEFVAQIDAREKYYVMGNHDYWSGYAASVRQLMWKHGCLELSGVVETRSMGRVYGLDWVERRRYPKVEAEGLVVVHDPNAADAVKGSCLILSGHTHGGLVIGGHVLYSNSKYVRGFYSLGEKKLYVSRGLGQMIPFRLGSPPEILVLS
ncbi:MAG: metallophosphoesterase [Candidatus Caldarchaeum sp.]|nr:metallophosphoesterase [Candidatus Caldarchaeum sp.]